MTILFIPAVPAESSLAPLLRRRPLALLPVAGRELVAYQLDLASSLGADRVVVAAEDRPELVRRFAAGGGQWGLEVEVVPVAAGLSVGEQVLRSGLGGREVWALHPHAVVPPLEQRGQRSMPAAGWRDEQGWLLCSVVAGGGGRTGGVPADPAPGPGAELRRTWRINSAGALHAASLAMLAAPHGAVLPGFEVAPGIIVSRGSRFSLGAVAEPPVLVAARARVSHRANLGPGVVVGDSAIIDDDATLRHSVVMPRTYVGRLLEADGVILDGRLIVRADDGTVAMIGDDLLLADLDADSAGGALGSFAGRAVGIALAAALSPLLGLAWLTADRPRLIRRQSLSHRCRYAVDGRIHRLPVTVTEINSPRPAARFIGHLLDIARGRIAVVGNPPLDVARATELDPSLVERWLERQVGMFGLAQSRHLLTDGGTDIDAVASAAAVFSGTRRARTSMAEVLRGVGRLLSPSAWRCATAHPGSPGSRRSPAR